MFLTGNGEIMVLKKMLGEEQLTLSSSRNNLYFEGSLPLLKGHLSSSRNNLYFEGSSPLLKGHIMVTKKT